MAVVTHGWFGQSWGAPCCEPEEHVPTPVGSPCLRCREPIREGDQGLVKPHIRDCGGQWVGTIEPLHIECFLRSIRRHGPECPHCRGVEPRDHAPGCAMRTTGLCDCQPMPAGAPEQETLNT